MYEDESVEEKLEEASTLVEKAEKLADADDWAKVVIATKRARLELTDAAHIAKDQAEERL